MATTTANRATKSAAENVNAAAAAASQTTTSARRSRIVVAGIPAPAAKTEATAQPQRVNIESLTTALQTKGTAKLSDHATPATEEAKTTAKPDTATSAPTVQAAPQPRELTAEERAAELQRQIAEREKALQAALLELTRKKELSDHRDRFLKGLSNLAAAEQELNKTDDFDGDANFRIAFQGKPDGYRWDNIFTFGNADLQREFIKFIRAKMKAKLETIEAELIK